MDTFDAVVESTHPRPDEAPSDLENETDGRIALLSIRALEERVSSLEETVEILADRTLLRGIKLSIADLREGRFKRFESTRELRRSLRQP